MTTNPDLTLDSASDSHPGMATSAREVIDSLAEHRASGRCAPKSWGFLLDEARATRLRQMVAESTKPLPAWALRECQRLLVPTRTIPGKAA